MNAVSPIALTLPADPTFEQWIDAGRTLAANRRQLDWLVGDWLQVGRERFHDQAEFAFLADALGVSPRMLGTVEKAVRAFPPHLRDQGLTIEHHAHAAALPEQERLPFLNRARREHWTPEQARIEVVKLRTVIGERSVMERDDPDYDELIAISRAWNRAHRHVREQFADLVRESDLGVIDA